LAGSVAIVHRFLCAEGQRLNLGDFMEPALLAAVTATLVARTVLHTQSE
jgi:hypothetical protein